MALQQHTSDPGAAMMIKKIVSLMIGVLLTGSIVSTSHSAPYWTKIYGGDGDEGVKRVRQTTDGGYIFAGWTTSFAAASKDGWLVKLNENGDVTWGKTYGGSYNDVFEDIQQTADDGYIVAGKTQHSSYPLRNDAWILKLDNSGDVTWQKTYGANIHNYAYSIQQTSDGGYVVAGTMDTDPSSNTVYAFWIFKLDYNGDIIWQKTYGGTDDDYAFSIQQTLEGGYIVVGTTTSFGAGDEDVWILKIDPNGDIVWQWTYGGSDRDRAYAIQQTTDSGYVVAGYTKSFGAINGDCWIFKLDSEGTIVWQKTFGESRGDFTDSIQPTSDGGFIVAGVTGINAQTFEYGDALLLKLDSDGNISWYETYDLDIRIISFSIEQTTDSGYIAVGEVDYSFLNARYTSIWGLKVDENGEIPGCSLISNQSCNTDNSSASAQDTVASVMILPINISSPYINIQNAFVEDLVFCCYDQADNDQDGIGNGCDNCPDTSNPNQEDYDEDITGDICDDCTDTDSDGYGNPGYPNPGCEDDNCPDGANPNQEDLDVDGLGDACDNCPNDPENDIDNDNICGDVDNCPYEYNYLQEDTDSSGIGDACNDAVDADDDEWEDNFDNCPDTPNPDQKDTYPPEADGKGNACDGRPYTEWVLMDSGVNHSLEDIWGISESEIFVSGWVGSILHYDGITWAQMPTDTTNALWGIWGNSNSDIFAAGFNSTILHFDGYSWSTIYHFNGSLYSIWGRNESDVYGFGSYGDILHYNGLNWSEMESGTRNSLFGAWGNSMGDLFAVGVNGTILHYDENTWSPMDSGVDTVLLDIWGSSEIDIFAVGYDGITGTVLHYDGNAWTQMDCGTTERLAGVWGSAPNDVFAVGDRGTILHYNGHVWNQIDCGITSYFNAVWVMEGRVYVVGDSGVILYANYDLDLDGIINEEDNCPNHYNANQEDLDSDYLGDTCDNDKDGDDVLNMEDNCVIDDNPDQLDSDNDEIGDICDNCPYTSENDTDNDGVCGEDDNCLHMFNADQMDTYPPQGNGIGDVCDCEADFDCDGDVDGSDATSFKLYFGRNLLFYPCDAVNPCRGDFDCDQDCDGTDASLFKSDFSRSEFNNACPACVVGDWCSYL
jgi:hypothetical protein